MSTLEKAVRIAAEAHEGQVDKAGTPYLLHPLRLMLQMSNDEHRIVAVLHDVVEDSDDWTFDALREMGFSESVVQAVDALTRRDGETYEDFVLRAARNPIAKCVKLADLRDNSDLSRISAPTARDHKRVEKYARAIALLDRKD